MFATRLLYEGVSKLKLSASLGVILSVLSITVSFIGINSLNPIYLAFTAIFGFMILILELIAWALKIIGWGRICSTRIKKFYCWTRLALIIFPIIGMLASFVGFLVIFLRQPLSMGVGNIAKREKSFETIGIIGGLIFSLGYLFEAVGLYDFSLIYRNSILRVGSILYIISIAVSPISSLIEATTVKSLLNNSLHFISSFLVFLGLAKIQKAIIHGTQYPSQGEFP
ncbi:MAG: hypothetical protein B6U94_02705 [Thermofilum sp. ex4484_79]|nr:MAG: hypothetical protein B6U94_02705 [Thermofilum sp. ex4484_79]